MQQGTNISSDKSNFTGSGFSSSSKYKGLIEEKFSKKIRNLLGNLLIYFDSFVPPFYSLHSFIGFMRIIQLIGMAFSTGFPNIWVEKTKSRTFINIVSVAFNVIPSDYRDLCSIPFGVIVIVIYSGFLITMLFVSFYYEKHSKVNQSLCITLSLFISTIGYLLGPAALEISAEQVSRIINGIETKYSMIANMIINVLVIILTVTYYFYYRKIYAFSFIFRPTSLLSLEGSSQMILFGTAYIQGFLTGINTFMPKSVKAGICFVCAILALYGTYRMIKSQLVVSFFHEKMFIMFTVDAFLTHAFIGVSTLLETPMKPAYIIYCVAAAFLIYFISSIYVDKQIAKHLQVLDQAIDDMNAFDEIKSKEQLLTIAITGMSFAHPSATNWSVFKHITDRFPDAPECWAIFGKFVAIYPEETALHAYIIHTIVQRGIHGMLAKQTVSQSLIIMQQREPNLTISLKTKIEKVQKYVFAAKRKIRRIWDQVIQGNINEMESAIENAYKAVQVCEAEFARLLIMFPNNRFVARLYSRFLYEVQGDFTGHQEWSEKVRTLQRGVFVNADRTQYLGLHAFPNLPASPAKAPTQQASNESNSTTTEGDIDDDTLTQQREDSIEINEYINVIKIPAARMMNVFALIYLVLIVTYSSVYAGMSSTFVNPVTEPVGMTNSLSYLHISNALLPALQHYYVLEAIQDMSIPNNSSDLRNVEGLGSTIDIAEQIRYVAKETTKHVKTISEFRGFGSDDSDLTYVREKLFKNLTSYISYSNANAEPKDVSLTSVFADYSVQAIGLIDLDKDTITDATLSTPYVKNGIINNGNISDAIDALMDETSKYVGKAKDKVDKRMYISMWVIFAVTIFVFGFGITFERNEIVKDKFAIYRCLMSLPKGVVSSNAEHLRILNKESREYSKTSESDSEINKQEENMLKVFAAASDNANKWRDLMPIFVSAGLMIACYLINGYFFYEYNIGTTAVYSDTAAEIQNVARAAAHLIKATTIINELLAESKSHYVTGAARTDEHIENLKNQADGMEEAHSAIRYGEGGVGTYEKLTYYSNQVPEKAGCNPEKEPETLLETLNCFTADVSYQSLKAIAEKIARINDDVEKYAETFWEESIYVLYGRFFEEAYSSSSGYIDDEANSVQRTAEIVIIICNCVVFICSIVLIVKSRMIRDKDIYALRLLLNCPAQSVFQNQRIMEVLGGNFNNFQSDSATRNSEFYDSVINELPDSIIVCDQNLNIITANKSTQSIYKLQEPLESTNARDFFMDSKFIGDMEQLFTISPTSPSEVEALYTLTVNQQASEEQSSNNQTKSPEVSEKLRLFITGTSIGSNFVFSTHNVTKIYYYNRLIQEEKAKSDKLLNSILPPSLVPRVQNGEKNISFSIQSASIVFIDIVEFTPWCASNTASAVTNTLNAIFKEFDLIVNSLTVMSKIKCIGDCYMCAGGIFSEVNNPALNAKEAVEFGLRAIDTLGKVNESLGQQLRIRVGVNAGGPIVAGVLGTEKPTFEIFGPAINMAQQMEHHGVPMNVHISRTVYELIYGMNFNIQERGEIDIKNGKVVTYLVSK